MKFLVLTLCVCAASAASFGYKPYQPAQQVANAFAQTVVAPAAAVASAPVVAAKAAYSAAKAVVAAPIYAAKAVYDSGKEASAAIVRSESEVSPDGFNYFYETENGISSQASGVTKQVEDKVVVAIQGSYKYIAPDGTPVEFTYIADENGYQPQSNLIPVAPPVPEEIARSLEYLRAHPPKPENI